MKVGENCDLFALQEGECGLLEGREFMVVEWHNGDRVSDTCKIVYRDGTAARFSRDTNDPKVMFTGVGERLIQYKWPDGKTTGGVR